MNRSWVWAALSGLLFGFGLIVSGMTDPAKVQGFLDLAGAWNPSLALVMAAAIPLAALGFRRARHQSRAWSGEAMQLPGTKRIDGRLVGGGVLFGIGWGVAGLCPGPALVALSAGYVEALIFVAAMLVGMGVHDGVLADRS